MNNFKLRTVAKQIATSGKITKTSAKKIETLLSAKDVAKLAEFIKIEQEKQTVQITTADAISSKTSRSISDMFGGKRVITTIDKKIGAGVKAQVYDMIYDLTIKSKINNLVERLEEEI